MTSDSSQPYLQYSAEARLYEYQERIFVCSVRWIAETDSITVLNLNVSDCELGEIVQRHIAEYDPVEWDISGRNMSDWAAYRASGAKSVKAFEQKLWHVDLAIMNSALLIWARPRVSLKEDISIYSTANKLIPDNIGRAIREAISAAKVLRECGAI